MKSRICLNSLFVVAPEPIAIALVEAASSSLSPSSGQLRRRRQRAPWLVCEAHSLPMKQSGRMREKAHKRDPIRPNEGALPFQQSYYLGSKLRVGSWKKNRRGCARNLNCGWVVIGQIWELDNERTNEWESERTKLFPQQAGQFLSRSWALCWRRLSRSRSKSESRIPIETFLREIWIVFQASSPSLPSNRIVEKARSYRISKARFWQQLATKLEVSK